MELNSALHLGSSHLLGEILRQNQLLEFFPTWLEFVRNYTQINGHFGHEEPVIHGLIYSENREDRELGLETIIRVRRLQEAKMREEDEAKMREGEVITLKKPKEQKGADKTVRAYKPRPLNWNAQTIGELIDLTKAETEPPLTQGCSMAEVLGFLEEPFKYPPYKCNSQFVKRAVKTTSKIVANYPGHDEQDGAILNTESSRAKMPTSSKKPKLSQLVN